MRPLRKSNWLLVALVAGVVVLTLTGLALLGAYLYLSREAAAKITWVSPVEAVRPQAVAPDLAVLSLAGEPEDRVIRAALDANEIETAYAGLAYSVLLPDSQRSGHWLLLADRYLKAEPERAASAVQAALDVAALSPYLSDMTRADISMQAASRFVELQRMPAARLALAQAESIARHSLMLLPAQRRTILERVEAAYRALGDAATAQALRTGMETASAGPGVKVEPGQPVLPALRSGVKLPPPVVTAMTDRQQAAAQMAARWLSSSPNTRNALVESLGKALRAEDAARAEFYAAAANLPDADRLTLLHDRVAWLTMKYRAASGAFGAALASEWAQQVEVIRDELVGAHTDLTNGYGRQLDTLLPADAGPARVELLRQALLAARLGLFPDPAAEKPLHDQLLTASRDLWTRQGGEGLLNVVQEAQGQRYYLLSGSDARQQPATRKP
ncbi:MAG: hypothetical protein MUC51_00290 [Anaerolineae bacterium]|jgi:hypothetical protein|nr:hypothetical protein [Anaerolineae bacterium]